MRKNRILLNFVNRRDMILISNTKGRFAMKPNPTILHAAVNVMSTTARDVRPDFDASIASVNHNGLSQAVWARRGQQITDKFPEDDNIKIRHVQRGGFWQFEAVVDVQQREVFLLMTHDNLKALQKRFKANGYCHHYLFSLLRLNPEVKSEQQSLFQLDEDEEAAREKDCDNILGEFAGEIDRVYVVAFDYAESLPTGGAVYLLDQNGSTIESIDISDMLVDQEETTEEDSLGTDPVKRPSESTPLVKLKIKKA